MIQEFSSNKNPFTVAIIILWLLGLISITISSYYYPPEITSLSFSLGSSSAGVISLLLLSLSILLCYNVWTILTFKYRAHLYLDNFNKQINEEKIKAINNAKFSSIANMAAGIAHEVNNPLAIISGIEQRANRALKIQKEESITNKDLQTIREQIKRISKITKSLKDMMIVQNKSNYQYKSVKEIIDQTLSILKEQINSNNIDLTVNSLDFDDFIYCNPNDISQIVYNLVTNSIYQVTQVENRWIEIAVLETVQGVQVNITDSGKKPAKDIAEKIFDPFYTTRDIGASLGMGLTISRSIAKSYKGDLEFSPLEQHTTFKLYLSKDKS